MNKNILLISLMVMTLTVSVAGMGTMAWFTDETTVEGNTFVTGEVAISHDFEVNLPFQFSSVDTMMPGDSRSGSVIINNDGSLPVYLKAEIREEAVTGVNNLAEKIDVTILLEDADSGVHEYTDKLSNLIDTPLIWKNAQGNSLEFDDGYLEFAMTTTLSETTDNAYANSSWTGDIVFTAVQSENQDPANIVWENPVE